MENTWKYVRDDQSHQPWLGAQCATFSWSLRSRGWEMATPDSKSVVPHGLVVGSGRESGHPVDMAQRWWLGRHSSVRTCPWQMDKGTVGHLWGEGDTDFTSQSFCLLKSIRLGKTDFISQLFSLLKGIRVRGRTVRLRLVWLFMNIYNKGVSIFTFSRKLLPPSWTGCSDSYTFCRGN